MDYEKAYKDAMARCELIARAGLKFNPGYIFPELAESEDERIINAIIGILKNSNAIDINVSQEKMVAYLEKQKESLHISEKCKENADSFTNEQQPLSTEETELNSLAFLEQMGYTCMPPVKEPKQEWSEEDEKMLKWLCRIVHSKRVDKVITLKEESELGEWMDKWLKSLRSRPHWKPTEEQMKALQNAVALTACDKELVRLYEQLKKLK